MSSTESKKARPEQNQADLPGYRSRMTPEPQSIDPNLHPFALENSLCMTCQVLLSTGGGIVNG